jgi:hypothetical protein
MCAMKKDDKTLLFERMEYLNPDFKRPINEEELEEGKLGRALGTAGMAAAMALSPMQKAQAQTQTTADDNKEKIVQTQDVNSQDQSQTVNPWGNPPNNLTELIKQPNDVVSFVKDLKTNNYSEQQISNLLNDDTKKHFIKLITSDNNWKNAFDVALDTINKFAGEGSTYYLHLKGDKAPQLGAKLDVDFSKPMNFQERENVIKYLTDNGMNWYRDFVPQIAQKGPEYKKWSNIYELLQYFNW